MWLSGGGEFRAERTADALGLVCACQSQGTAWGSAWLELSSEQGVGGRRREIAGRLWEPLKDLSFTLIEMGSH